MAGLHDDRYKESREVSQNTTTNTLIIGGSPEQAAKLIAVYAAQGRQAALPARDQAKQIEDQPADKPIDV